MVFSQSKLGYCWLWGLVSYCCDIWPPWGRLHRALIFISRRLEVISSLSIFICICISIIHLPVCICRFWEFLGESAIAVRTKAMKCLSEVVAVDPSILARVSAVPKKNKLFNVLICIFLTLIWFFWFSRTCSGEFMADWWITPPAWEKLR